MVRAYIPSVYLWLKDSIARKEKKTSVGYRTHESESMVGQVDGRDKDRRHQERVFHLVIVVEFRFSFCFIVCANFREGGMYIKRERERKASLERTRRH